jgi:hypothetical protein
VEVPAVLIYSTIILKVVINNKQARVFLFDLDILPPPSPFPTPPYSSTDDDYDDDDGFAIGIPRGTNTFSFLSV